jgi:hypothetical protein
MAACAECTRYKRAYGYAAEDLRNAHRKVSRAREDSLQAYAEAVREARAALDRARVDLNEHLAGCETARQEKPRKILDVVPEPKVRQRRAVSIYAIRYTPGTDLARRYPELPRARYKSREDAERVRGHCVNAEHMEVVDVRDVS